MTPTPCKQCGEALEVGELGWPDGDGVLCQQCWEDVSAAAMWARLDAIVVDYEPEAQS